MSVHLLGGGRDVARIGRLLRPFVGEARAVAGRGGPVIALLLVLEPDDDASVVRFVGVLESAGAGRAEIRVEAVVEGEVFAPAVLGADALFVGGGLTPAYHDAVDGIRDAVAQRVREGMPYAGFSAGAAIAAERALVGGYRLNGVEVASEDASEEVDELDVRDGLGLVPYTVDVHAAQWGTLSRLVAAVEAGRVASGVAIDEHTAVIADGDDVDVRGSGRVWHVDRVADGVRVRAHGAADAR